MKPGGTTVVNDATLRRMRERIQQEHKKPEDNEGGATTAEDDPAIEADQPIAPQSLPYYDGHVDKDNHVSEPQQEEEEEEEEQDDEWYAQQLQQQEEFLQQVAQQRKNEQHKQLEQDVDQLQEHLVRTSFTAGEAGDSGSASEEDERWRCDDCGYDSPLLHRFCGVCGCQRPEDWLCEVCQYENCMYHRFCGMCGRPQQTAADILEYEDMSGLLVGNDNDNDNDAQSSIDSAEEDAIRQTVARLSQHQPIIPHEVEDHPQWGDADESSFADDCEDDVLATTTTTKVDEQKEECTGWSCPTCTYRNTNPLFLACEMCDTARPAGTTPPAPSQRKQPTTPSLPPTSEDPEKATERRFTEIMRLQQGLYQLAQGQEETTGANANVVQQHRPQQPPNQPQNDSSVPGTASAAGGAAGPETDHELALIYAQQERILAEYQKQQQQQQPRR